MFSKMFSRIRGRLTCVNVAMTFALVFAMSGGAFGASKYLITSTKQIKPSVLKRLAGKAGLAGKEGPKGTNGTNGANGEKGTPGTNGNPGTNGKSVVAGVEPKGANCAEGGSSFEVEGSAAKHYACNGKEGSPWTVGGTLPSAKTETGAWSGHVVGETEEALVPISFNIPVKAELASTNVHAVTIEEWKHENGKVPPAACEGTGPEPLAATGNLCVYIGNNFFSLGEVKAIDKLTGEFDAGASRTGAMVVVKPSSGNGGAIMYGTWAVTG
jgi:hypothetical protein